MHIPADTKPLTELRAYLECEVIFHYNAATQSSTPTPTPAPKLSVMIERRVKSTDVLCYLASIKISLLLQCVVHLDPKCLNKKGRKGSWVCESESCTFCQINPKCARKHLLHFLRIQQVKWLKEGVMSLLFYTLMFLSPCPLLSPIPSFLSLASFILSAWHVWSLSSAS